MRSHGALGGPHLASPVIGGVVFPDKYAFCVECMPDRDMMDFVVAKRVFADEAELLRLVKQVAHGLRTIHSRGYVHRDIKPDNMYRDGPTVKLADFGFASHAAEVRRLGSLHYVAPEVVTGEHPITAATDMWALGASIFVIAANTWPHSTRGRDIHSLSERDKALSSGSRPLPPPAPSGTTCPMQGPLSLRSCTPTRRCA